MLNLKNYYLYGTSGIDGMFIAEGNILKILREGKIKTRKSLDLHWYACNREDEICLVDPQIKVSKFNLNNSAFNMFVKQGPSLVLSRDIPGIYKPEVITNNPRQCIQLNATNLLDEVRHKGNISLKYLEFITVPFTAEHRHVEPSPDKLQSLLPIITSIEEEFPNIEIKDLYTGLPISSNKIKGKLSVQETISLDNVPSLIKINKKFIKKKQ